jgi:hypothetical protein
MLKYFNKLPKGKVAEPLPVLAQQATVAAEKRKVVGRPPSATKNNKSKIGELNSLSSTTSSNNAKELVVVAEKILIERLQKDGTILAVPVIILAGENEYNHCTIVDSIDADPRKQRKRNFIRSECHAWGADGSHIGFRTGFQTLEKIIQMVPNVAIGTVCNILTVEKANYNTNAGENYRHKPTLEAMHTPLENVIENVALDIALPEEKNSAGRPFFFPKELYVKLKKRVLQFKNRTGDIMLCLYRYYVN